MAKKFPAERSVHVQFSKLNANLIENDFRIKKINAKEEVEFQNKGN